MSAGIDWMLETLKDWLESGAAFLALLWLTIFSGVAILITILVLYWTSRGPWDAAHVKAEQDENTAKLNNIYRAIRETH